MRGVTALALLTLLSASGAALQAKAQNAMDDLPIVKLRALDKITARTLTFQADVGSTVKFGSLYVKVQACRKAPPIEPPESAAFLQIWEEHQAQEQSSIGIFNATQEWVFSGWMFASSPALSYVDHPIYDVWVIDCLEDVTQRIIADEGEVMDGEGQVDDSAQESQAPDITPQEARIEDAQPEEQQEQEIITPEPSIQTPALDENPAQPDTLINDKNPFYKAPDNY